MLGIHFSVWFIGFCLIAMLLLGVVPWVALRFLNRPAEYDPHSTWDEIANGHPTNAEWERHKFRR